MSQTHSQHRHLTCEGLDESQANARFLRPPRPRRAHDAARPEGAYERYTEVVALANRDIGRKTAQHMHENPCEGVAVIADQPHRNPRVQKSVEERTSSMR